MPFRRYQHEAGPLRCPKPHNRPYALGPFLVRQWDQLEFDRRYGRCHGRDAEDDITRKVKLKIPILLDGQTLKVLAIGSLIWITLLIGMKCQDTVMFDLPT